MNIVAARSRWIMFALSVALPLLATSQIAIAQFVWLDNNGVRQYSDRPPPTSIPRKRILKSPAETAPLAVSESAAKTLPENAIAVPATATPNPTGAAGTVGAAAVPPKNNAPLTTAERNADFMKRKMDEAAKEKKAAETAKLAADKKANCARARSYSRGLEDGGRIATVDKNGERTYMSDEQRAEEIRHAQTALAGCR